MKAFRNGADPDELPNERLEKGTHLFWGCSENRWTPILRSVIASQLGILTTAIALITTGAVLLGYAFHGTSAPSPDEPLDMGELTVLSE